MVDWDGLGWTKGSGRMREEKGKGKMVKEDVL